MPGIFGERSGMERGKIIEKGTIFCETHERRPQSLPRIPLSILKQKELDDSFGWEV
jgi:hypothetical protein